MLVHNEMLCAIWYYLYKSKYEGMLLLVKLQALVCNFTKSNTNPWVFFTFLNYKLYQIAHRIKK